MLASRASLGEGLFPAASAARLAARAGHSSRIEADRWKPARATCSIGFFVLAVIAAVFGFVYWLQQRRRAGRAHASTEIRFESTVSGLLPGRPCCSTASVSARSPASSSAAAIRGRSLATIAVDATRRCARTPQVGMEFQGLTGVAVDHARGRHRDRAARRGRAASRRVLVADPAAGPEHDASRARGAAPRRRACSRRMPSRCARRSPTSTRSRPRSRAIPIASTGSWPAWSA